MWNESSLSLRDIGAKKPSSNRNSAKYPKMDGKARQNSREPSNQMVKQTSDGALNRRRHSEDVFLCAALTTSATASDPAGFRWSPDRHDAAPGEQWREALDGRYRECVSRIRRRAAGKKIWTSLDVTVDPADGELLGNVVIGTLSPDCPGETFLLAVGALRGGGGGGDGDGDGPSWDARAVGQAAARLFDDAMGLLWPDGVRHGDVLLLLQSAAWPQRSGSTADCLAAAYAKMVPVACPASALRAVAERVCAACPAVDALVANAVRALSPAAGGDPSLYARLRARARVAPPPPTPASGCAWATAWIGAVSYLSENFRAVRDALNDETDGPPRDPDGPAARARWLAGDPTAEPGLAYVDLNYGFLPAAVARIEARDARLADTVAAASRAADRLSHVAGDLGAALHRRYAGALRDDRGFRALAGVAAAREPPGHTCGGDLEYFKYAPIAAVDVRAAFPRYEAVLRDCGGRDKGVACMALVVQCNDAAAAGPSAFQQAAASAYGVSV